MVFKGYSYVLEIYLEICIIQVLVICGKYFLFYCVAFNFEYCLFWDIWDIDVYNFDLGYIYLFGDWWIFDIYFCIYE